MIKRADVAGCVGPGQTPEDKFCHDAATYHGYETYMYITFKPCLMKMCLRVSDKVRCKSVCTARDRKRLKIS